MPFDILKCSLSIIIWLVTCLIEYKNEECIYPDMTLWDNFIAGRVDKTEGNHVWQNFDSENFLQSVTKCKTATMSEIGSVVKVSSLGFEHSGSIPTGDWTSFIACFAGTWSLSSMCFDQHVTYRRLHIKGLANFFVLAICYWISPLNNNNKDSTISVRYRLCQIRFW